MTADSGGDSPSDAELLRRLDRPARHTRTGVARRIGFQIVFLVVNDNRLADDRVRTAQTQFSFPIEMRFAGCIGFDIPKVTLVMHRRRGTAVVLRSEGNT